MVAGTTQDLRAQTASDAAVDGLVSGLLAGVAMGIFLLTAGLAQGESLVAVLGRFTIAGRAASPLSGVLLHLAVSAIYGILCGLVFWLGLRRRLAGRPAAWGALPGALFGLLLWLAAEFVLIPASGSLAASFPAWQFALAHLLFGAILGWWVLRSALGRRS